MDWSRLLAASAKVYDMAQIIHEVPAHRVKRALPKRLEVESVRLSGRKEESAFVSVVCSHKKFSGSAALGLPKLDFWELSYRAYCLNKGSPCVYIFGSYLGTWSSFAYSRVNSSDTHKARINVNIRRDNSGGYDIYDCRSLSDNGATDFFLRAKARPKSQSPFQTGADKSAFFNERYHQIMRTHGLLTDQMVSHRPLAAKEGELLDFNCDLWVKLGVLKNEEFEDRFFCALVTPSVEILYYPKVPNLLIPRAA